jgi:hypothetical protein
MEDDTFLAVGLLQSSRAAAREKKKVDDDTLSAAGSLRSSRAAAREKKKVDDDTLLAAGSPRSSRAAARQKKKVAHESFAAASTIPTEVVTRLYHRGKLVKVIQLPKKSKNDVVTKPTIARGDGLLYSEDDKYLNNVDEGEDDEDEYEDNNFSSVHPDDVVSRNRIPGGPQRLDTSKMNKKVRKSWHLIITKRRENRTLMQNEWRWQNSWRRLILLLCHNGIRCILILVTRLHQLG